MEGLRPGVCRDCWLAIRRVRPARNAPFLTNPRQILQRTFTATARHSSQHRPRRPGSGQPQHGLPRMSTSNRMQYSTGAVSPESDLDHNLGRTEELCDIILKSPSMEIPAEQRTLYIFEQLQQIASMLVDAPSNEASPTKPKDRVETATSALLGSVHTKQRRQRVTRAQVIDKISEGAERIIRDGRVFITPAILKSYVTLQSSLHRPTSLPDAFVLYAEKPSPRMGKQEIEYTPTNPNKVNAAIDSKTADMAVTAALRRHDLPLAIDIIHTTFCAPAYKKAKVLRQAMVPILGLGVAPVAAYTLATQFSNLQPNMDPVYTTGVAFAGIMTYVAAVAGMGYVAVTTANDQMDRVTWAQGVPLWERWVREEERAAIDRVAGQWGFKSIEKRGDEEGEEWEMLREFVGLRGMVLDKVALMQGME